jgi:hypothetical protein
LGAITVSGIKTEARITPQKTKNLFTILSAKNPKRGCNIEEHICEILMTIVATAIGKPSFDAINGIIGFKNPL